jgi:DNA replication protein DnaC
MTTLEQKLQQLNLTAMSHQLEKTLAEAATQNLSLAATLEALADLELEARRQRAIERRFRLSHLQTQLSIDSFDFHHHKSRQQIKNRALRLLDLDFLQKGTNVVIIGNPGLLASQVDHSLIRKLRFYTSPTLLVCDELGYLSLDRQTSNLFYQVISTRHSQKKSILITNQHRVLRLGEHPL